MSRQRTTLVLDEHVRYEGAVNANGQRHGRGTLIMGDEDGDATWLSGNWSNDCLHGPSVYAAADGSTCRGTYDRGTLKGHVVERHSDGTLRFAGAYADGARHGPGLEVRSDGGCLEGTWRAGELHGAMCCFHFPCARGAALVGEWADGDMVRARFVELAAPPDGGRPGTGTDVATAEDLEELPEAARVNPVVVRRALAALRARTEPLPRPPPGPTRTSFAYGPATETELPALPDLPDPLEAVRVDVKASLMEGAGRGLFAKVDLPVGTAVAFFAGLRVSEGEAVSAMLRAGREAHGGARAHAVPLGEGEGVLVPMFTPTQPSDAHVRSTAPAPAAAARSTLGADDGARAAPPEANLAGRRQLSPRLQAATLRQEYRASLGHFANHSFASNAELRPFDHPRLGRVACVRVRAGVGAGRGVRAGAELTVDYPIHPEHQGHPQAEHTCAGSGEGRGVAGCARPQVGHVVHPSSGPGLPEWFSAYGARRDEEGYYFHLRMRPPVTLFQRPSACAHHGAVRVVAHGPWRALWLGRVEQGLTYVPQPRGQDQGDGTVGASPDAVGQGPRGHAAKAAGDVSDPSVIGFEYVRTAAAVAVACAKLWRAPPPGSARPLVVAVGLGAGTLPHFCAHHFPRCRVLAVEVDRMVVAAACGPLANPSKLPFEIALGDAAEVLSVRAGGDDAGSAACVLLDAYDGRGRVPLHLQQPAFLAVCARLLRPGGAVVANVFNGEDGSEVRKRRDAFAEHLAHSIGPVEAAPVRGHETNLVLIAVKAPATGRVQDLVCEAVAVLDASSGVPQGGGPPLPPEFMCTLRQLRCEPHL